MITYFGDVRFQSGIVRSKSCFHILGMPEEPAEETGVPRSRIHTFKGGRWSVTELPWPAAAFTLCTEPEPHLLVIGSGGMVYTVGETSGQQEKAIFVITPDNPFRGPLRDVAAIPGGHPIAVGAGRQAYRREGPNSWVCIDQTLPKGAPGERCFESVAGFSENEVYAVGLGGDIWYFDGRIWNALPRVTHTDLHRVICAENGRAYACGQSGILLAGRKDRWKVIDHGKTSEAFYGLGWINDTLYVASTSFLYLLENTELMRVGFDDEIPGTCHHLSSGAGSLLSVGRSDALYFDGKHWYRLI